MKHRRILRWSSSLISVLMLLAGASRPACADGGVFVEVEWDSANDVEMPAQKAIIVYDEQSQREDIVLSVELRGGPEAGWVVPVPSLPEVETARLGWFQQLSDLTKPRIEYRVVPIHISGSATTVEGAVEVEPVVELLSREEVGVYDVSILSADEAKGLIDRIADP